MADARHNRRQFINTATASLAALAGAPQVVDSVHASQAAPQPGRAGGTALHAKITDRVAPGVVYTTFHHPDTQANVVTTDYSDWATNCPEYKVTAVQVSPSNGPSDWQREYNEQAEHSRRIAKVAAE